MKKSYFELFGLPAKFDINQNHLDQSFRKLQSEVHPDRYVSATEAEHRQSLQWSTYANEAYQTLKDPVERSRYLLQLNGIDTKEDTNTVMPNDFLMQQMEYRELIETAIGKRDVDMLNTLSLKLQKEAQILHQHLLSMLDIQKDFQEAYVTVRKLSFFAKLKTEIDHAYDVI